MTTSLEVDGFQILPPVTDPGTIVALCEKVAPVLAQHLDRGGIRNLLGQVPSLVPIVTGPLRELVEPVLGPDAVAVRALLFDKTPLANWKATWHQDVTVSVTEYRECDGWGPWSMKSGVWHVRAPALVLAGMLTVRLHLDTCGPANGPVRVLPGTHTLGRLSDADVERVVRHAEVVDCLVPEGGVLLMRPLLLHASAPAAEPTHRRVIHIEFAPGPLPDGFSWAESWR